MSWKSQIINLSVVACLSAGLTNHVHAQNSQPSKTNGAVTEQTDRELIKQDAEDDYSEMTLDDLTKDLIVKIRAYSRRYRSASTAAEKREIAKTVPTGAIYKDRLVELINEDPGSDAGLEAIDWWFKRGGRSRNTGFILDLTMKNYSKLPSIKKYVPYYRWFLEADVAEAHLRQLLSVNPDDGIRAYAQYELHELMREQLDELDGEDAETVRAEMKTFRDSIYGDHAEATDVSGAKLVTLLEAVDFEKQLQVGKPVPDIVGVDLDGVEFKLSDYDGKVRVISFWGDW